MKRNILKSLSCVFLIAMLTGCSSENDMPDGDVNESVLYNDSSSDIKPKSGSVWDGLIAVDRGNEVYDIVANQRALIADFEIMLVEQGIPDKLESLSIIKRTALNNPSASGFLLIATNSSGMSIGTGLTRVGSGGFYLENPKPGGGGPSSSVSCKGCASGCNLEFFVIDNKKVPYCNENGCEYDCTKIEQSR